MYIRGASPVPITTRPSVLKLWSESKQALESCGAVVVEVDFPLVTHYEDCDASTDQWARIDNMPKDWLHTERHELIAHAWDDFLATNAQADCNSLSCVNPDSIFPLAPGSLPGESEADNQLDWIGLVNYPKNKPSSMFQLPGMKEGLKSLEEARRHTLENWMKNLGLDAVVFPANGDVGPADADIDNEASRLAWRNGVLYSNGNLSIRHLGVPTISVPMGIMEDTKMPVNITFAGRAYDDNRLLECGCAFEAATQHRQMPPLVPALDSDMVSNNIIATGPSDIERATVRELPRIKLIAKHKRIDGSTVHLRVEGVVTDPTEVPTAENLTCYINGEAQSVTIDGQKWEIDLTRPLSGRESPWARWTSPALVQTVIVMTYLGGTGIAAGELIIL